MDILGNIKTARGRKNYFKKLGKEVFELKKFDIEKLKLAHKKIKIKNISVTFPGIIFNIQAKWNGTETSKKIIEGVEDILKDGFVTEKELGDFFDNNPPTDICVSVSGFSIDIDTEDFKKLTKDLF